MADFGLMGLMELMGLKGLKALNDRCSIGTFPN